MNRRGFAAILGIFAIALVAATLTALAMAFTGEYRRTVALEGDAQVRQLLLAGAADISAHASQWPAAAPTQSWSLQLPEQLEKSGARVTIQFHPTISPSIFIDLNATAAGRHGWERLELRRSENRWQLVGVNPNEGGEMAKKVGKH